LLKINTINATGKTRFRKVITAQILLCCNGLLLNEFTRLFILFLVYILATINIQASIIIMFIGVLKPILALGLVEIFLDPTNANINSII